jgi:ribosomal protein S18 acetylase RimI-like enzyme
MKLDSNIQIRSATPDDKGFILSLLPRLVEFGPPPWRDASQMTITDTQVLCDSLSTQSSSIAVFIAEDKSKALLGFIHLKTTTDYYTREEHGHIADIVVAREGEGRGIGRALMAKGEEWARSKGYRWLTLNVFVQNLHAREVYKRLGYGEDIMSYVKELG